MKKLVMVIVCILGLASVSAGQAPVQHASFEVYGPLLALGALAFQSTKMIKRNSNNEEH